MGFKQGQISDNIECMWEIMKTDSVHFPFALVRTGPNLAPMAFHCKTEHEAHSKLCQLAIEFDRLGHKMTLA